MYVSLTGRGEAGEAGGGREWTRALLANVELVQVLAAARGSSFRSPLFRFMAWLIVSALPVAVFLAVQISFLRYQSAAITTLHRSASSSISPPSPGSTPGCGSPAASGG